MDEGTIDFFSPATIMFFVMAIMADGLFLGIFGVAIPAVGLAILMYILIGHYLIGFVACAFFWGKTKGIATKIILFIAWLLPLPLLSGGLVVAIFLSTKVGQEIVEIAEKEIKEEAEAAILAAAVVAAPETGGTSLAAAGAVEGGTVVAVEGGVAVAEGGAAVAEGAAAAGEGVGAAAEAGAEGAEAGANAGANGTDAFNNPLDNPVGETGRELDMPSEEQFREGEGFDQGEAQEEPDEDDNEKEDKTAKRYQKMIDIVRNNSGKSEPEEDKEEEDGQSAEEDLSDAA
jgi:hypothetical protein